VRKHNDSYLWLPHHKSILRQRGLLAIGEIAAWFDVIIDESNAAFKVR